MVLGGGVINGLSLQNVWPGERVVVILKDDPDLRARMGAAGRERVLARYAVDRLVDDVDRLYRSLLQAR